MAADRSELDEALDKGGCTELPPNIPPGFLGEVAPDLRKIDTFKPSLNAGVIQESSPDTRHLTMLLLYLLVFTSPVAAWMLWRDRSWPLWAKVVATGFGVLVYVAAWVYARH
jgi:hypothetical protein